MDYIIHYGVKGMRWGVRKEEKPRNERLKLTDKQKKYIKIGAVAVGASLAVYGSYKLYKNIGYKKGSMLSYSTNDPLKDMLKTYPDKDILIKKSQKLQRVSADAFEDLREKGYTYLSYTFRDKQAYLSGFRNEINRSGPKDFVHKFAPKSDLKIASPGTVAKEFLRMKPDARDNVFRMVASPYSSYGDIPVVDRMRDELFKSLKSKGYSGYIDIEDASKRAISKPVILFDPDNYILVTKSRKIKDVETIIAKILK